MAHREERQIYEGAEDEEQESSRIMAKVCAFTKVHVDKALWRTSDPEAYVRNVGWLDELKNLPFYSCNMERLDQKRWSFQQEDINHTGNESDGPCETSLYLACHAIVVVLDGPDNTRASRGKTPWSRMMILTRRRTATRVSGIEPR